jgi:hypothetical protein
MQEHWLNLVFIKNCSFVILLNGGENWFLHSWVTCIVTCNNGRMKEMGRNE